jgi:hypothetical protein
LIAAVTIPLAAVVVHFQEQTKGSSSSMQWLSVRNSAPSGFAVAAALLLPVNLSMIS